MLGNVLLVGYDHHGHSRLVYLLKNVHYLVRGLRVEGSGGFVGQNKLGLRNKRAGNSKLKSEITQKKAKTGYPGQSWQVSPIPKTHKKGFPVFRPVY